MAKSTKADKVAKDLLAAFADFLTQVPGSEVTVQRPAQGYTIVRLVSADSSDYEEVIVDTRPEDDNYNITHHTIPR